jgi:hypothetical protein
VVASDPRFDVGLLDMSNAARFLGIGRSRFQRWARGDAHGSPLLDVLHAASGQAQVTFIALAEAHVLEALRQAGARVRDVANMLNAGEDPQVVADEHGVSIEEVSTAARVLLGRAA